MKTLIKSILEKQGHVLKESHQLPIEGYSAEYCATYEPFEVNRQIYISTPEITLVNYFMQE